MTVPVLSFIEGARKGEQINLSRCTEFRIGRAHEHNKAKLDLPLDDSTVTAEHCVIYRRESFDYLIKDLGSSNGTFINGKRIKEPHTLSDGDCIRIGQTKLRFDRVQILPSKVQGTEMSLEERIGP